ncbi:hypothetical protein BD413DRAFT_523845 [Trametes elegans]|nr:hypothetical protein BD413DRAFT_523845 [Trametes elegans]
MASLKPEDVDAFFPFPTAAPSPKGPARLPGVTHESSVALLKTLKDDHIRFHAFFNDRGFHNHASHHLVAIYALGAPGPLIEAAYATHTSYLLPSFESPQPIDGKTFWLHLGKREYYDSYLKYFRGRLLEKDITEVLEQYFFTSTANIGGPDTGVEPNMLARLHAVLVHPLIHAGGGLEFGLLGLVAEGLAQAAVHSAQGTNLVRSASLFQHPHADPSGIARLTALLPSLSLGKSAANGEAASDKPSVHALSILGRVLADDKYSPDTLGLTNLAEVTTFDLVDKTVGGALADLAAEWAAELAGDGATSAAVERKIEELTWTNALIYGVGGWAVRDRSPTKKFTANFFNMHLVTSSLFLPSFVAYLSPRSAAILLESYFAISLGWYVAQGRYPLPIRDFYAQTTAKPTPPRPASAPPDPAAGTLVPADPEPNPWLPIVQTTIVHPGEHVCKLQRALLHGATVYGTRAPGHFADTGLDGADVLDGTLFIRAAGLTADRLGWMKEGQEAGEWDRPAV